MDMELLRVLDLHLATGGEPEVPKSPLIPQRDTQLCVLSEKPSVNKVEEKNIIIIPDVGTAPKCFPG